MKKSLTLFSLSLLLAGSLMGQAVQKVMIEEFTGAWCGFCPDGAYILDNILNSQPNAIGVSIHQGDAMQNTDGAVIDGFYNNSGYPSATINRVGESISRNNWASETNSQLSGTSPVAVSIENISYDWNTRTITCTPTFEVLSPLTGKFRINVWIIEDDVTGTGTGYNQVNYYNSTAGHPYYQAGDPIVGYVHKHTLRGGFLGGLGGPGVVPDDAPVGTYSYTLSKMMHSSWNEQNIHLVAYLQYFNGGGLSQRAVINAEEVPLSVALSSENGLESGETFLEVFPNPVNDRATVSFGLESSGNIRAEVLNTMGQQIAVLGEGWMNKGAHSLYWNTRNQNGTPVANGVYLVRLTTENGEHYTRRIQVAR